jgi:hypothetical protein
VDSAAGDGIDPGGSGSPEGAVEDGAAVEAVAVLTVADAAEVLAEREAAGASAASSSPDPHPATADRSSAHVTIHALRARRA